MTRTQKANEFQWGTLWWTRIYVHTYEGASKNAEWHHQNHSWRLSPRRFAALPLPVCSLSWVCWDSPLPKVMHPEGTARYQPLVFQWFLVIGSQKLSFLFPMVQVPGALDHACLLMANTCRLQKVRDPQTKGSGPHFSIQCGPEVAVGQFQFRAKSSHQTGKRGTPGAQEQKTLRRFQLVLVAVPLQLALEIPRGCLFFSGLRRVCLTQRLLDLSMNFNGRPAPSIRLFGGPKSIGSL